MPKYTYQFQDLLTQTPLDELPLYGVYFDKYLNTQGTFTGTIRMDNSKRKRDQILSATVPGKSALYVIRDNQPVWGGIVWSRTYNAAGRSMQFYAETFEGFANHQYNEIDNFNAVLFTDTSQVIPNVWNQIQADPLANINMQMPDTLPNTVFGPNKVLRAIDQDNYGQIISDIASLDDAGFDYCTNVFKDGSGSIQRKLIVGRPLGRPPSTADALVFKYPGSITDYFWPENVSRAANRLLVKGAGSDTFAFRSIYIDTTSLQAGYPKLMAQMTFPNDNSFQLVQQRAQAQGVRIKPPLVVPTFNVNTLRDPVFGSYQLGDYVTFEINDPYRFPDGFRTQQRIIGWTLAPGSSEGVESGSVVIEGKDIGGA